uniref:Uncharacterized protein n=1 Tax=Rhizophora mucronata TaxID=61149 RepID=A0A2P2NHD7_RHIMU
MRMTLTFYCHNKKLRSALISNNICSLKQMILDVVFTLKVREEAEGIESNPV